MYFTHLYYSSAHISSCKISKWRMHWNHQKWYMLHTVSKTDICILHKKVAESIFSPFSLGIYFVSFKSKIPITSLSKICRNLPFKVYSMPFISICHQMCQDLLLGNFVKRYGGFGTPCLQALQVSTWRSTFKRNGVPDRLQRSATVRIYIVVIRQIEISSAH